MLRMVILINSVRLSPKIWIQWSFFNNIEYEMILFDGVEKNENEEIKLCFWIELLFSYY